MKKLLLILGLVLYTSCGATTDIVTGKPRPTRTVTIHSGYYGFYGPYYNPYIYGYNPRFLGPRVIILSNNRRSGSTTTVSTPRPAPKPVPKPRGGGGTTPGPKVH